MKLLTTKMAADLLGVQQNTLRAWKCAKNRIWEELGPVKIGGRINYIESSVLAFIEKNKIVSEEITT